jgi:hypothetical protein
VTICNCFLSSLLVSLSSSPLPSLQRTHEETTKEWSSAATRTEDLSSPQSVVFVPSTALVVMDDDRHDVEVAILGPYQEKSKASKAFPSLKNKPPWLVKVLLNVDRRVYYALALLAFLFVLYVGIQTSPVIVFVFLVCSCSMLFACYLANWVLAKDEGPPEMSEIADAIRDGAEGFFRTQYGSISKMAVVLAFMILGIYLFRKSTPEQEAAGLEK